ncbi:MAG: SMP-30/gluconolactonase/LRE family protein [Pseudomonadota bacterium]
MRIDRIHPLTRAPHPELLWAGRDLVAPRGVLAHGAGSLITTDGRGGVTFIDPLGERVVHHRGADAMMAHAVLPHGPGSVCLVGARDGAGCVAVLKADGTLQPLLTAVDGAPLPPVADIARDGMGRLFITIPTHHAALEDAARPDVADGMIVLCPPVGAARVVARHLHYPAGCVVSADGSQLFVNETFGRATIAFDITATGSLEGPMGLAQYGDGLFPMGLADDTEGGLWVSSLVSRTVLRLSPGRGRRLVLQERDETRVSAVERAFGAFTLTAARLFAPARARLPDLAGLAFGGPDGGHLLLGNFDGSAIPILPVDVAGRTPNFPDGFFGPLVAAGVLPADWPGA